MHAEEHLLLHSQLTSLRDDYMRNGRGSSPLNNSCFKNVTVFIEESTKLLRLSGRIGAIEGVLTMSKNPIVLDGKDRVVKLLIAYHHERAAHSNNEQQVPHHRPETSG
jgi:hypothetical protein